MQMIAQWLLFVGFCVFSSDVSFGHLVFVVGLFLSIRAPARGAITCSRLKFAFVSIRAPTRGATMLCAQQGRVTTFQSAHPRGVRYLTNYFAPDK